MAKARIGRGDDPEVAPAREPTKSSGRQLAAAKKKATHRAPTAAQRAARVAVAKEKKGRPAQVIGITPLVTAERAFRSRSSQPVVRAFLHEEKLRGKIRKLTRPEWVDAFQTFLSVPR